MTDHATEQVALFMNARDHRDYGTAIWSELDIVGREAYLTDAAALVAAVKALGWAPALPPTDDEREALVHLFIAYQKRTGGLTNYSMMSALADIALAAGFRRSEVPEPRAPRCGEGEGHVHVAWCYMQGEPSDAPPEPSAEDWDNRDEEVNGETRGFLSCGRCAWSMSRGLFADLHEHERTHQSEPQGEPSDAQVDAASREIDLRGFHIPPMAVRAALRAASAVTEQGENR